MSILLLVKSPLPGFPHTRHIPIPLPTFLFLLYVLSSTRPNRPNMTALLRNMVVPPQETILRFEHCVPSDMLKPTSCSFYLPVSTLSCQSPSDLFSLCHCPSSPFSFHPTSLLTSHVTSAPPLLPLPLLSICATECSLALSLVVPRLFVLPPAAPSDSLWADDKRLRTSSSVVSVVVFLSLPTEESSASSPSSAPSPFCDSASPASLADL